MRNRKVKNLFFYGLSGISWMLSNALFFGQKWQRYSQYYFNGYESGHEQAVSDIKNGTNITLPQGSDLFEVIRPLSASGMTLLSNISYFLVAMGGMALIKGADNKISKLTRSALCVVIGCFWYFIVVYDFPVDKAKGEFILESPFKSMGQYSGYINGIKNITGNPHDPAGEVFAFLSDDYMNYLYATLLMGVIYATTALKTSRLGENFTLTALCEKIKFRFTFDRLKRRKRYSVS